MALIEDAKKEARRATLKALESIDDSPAIRSSKFTRRGTMRKQNASPKQTNAKLNEDKLHESTIGTVTNDLDHILSSTEAGTTCSKIDDSIDSIGLEADSKQAIEQAPTPPIQPPLNNKAAAINKMLLKVETKDEIEQ